jgi:hypothetical protein
MNRCLCLLVWTGSFLLLPAWVRADVVLDWNNVLLGAVRTAPLNPPRASRAMAMVHTAMYDAVNSVSQTHQPYHISLPAVQDTSREAAAAQAAHRVLSSLIPAQQANFDAALATSLSAIADGPGKTAGIDLGTSVGDAILALRANDHSDDVVPYTPGTNPGDWIPTPAANAPALLPNWPLVTPFVMTSGSQFRSQTGPPELNTAEYTSYFNEVKEIGSATSATRTAEQSNIAPWYVHAARPLESYRSNGGAVARQ